MIPDRAGPGRGALVLVGAAGAVAAVALQSAGLPWMDDALLVFLLVLLPVLSVLQMRVLGDVEVERMPAYVSSIVSLSLLGAVSWAVGSRQGGSAAVGLVPLPWGAFLGWTMALVVAGLAVTVVFRHLGTAVGLRESPLLRVLLPRSARERGAFAVLSVVAGVGEELAYRGYVIGTLAPVLGEVGAALLSTLVFGILHVYQGFLGIARTAALGGLLAWVFLANGSLWPAVAAHAILDILLGVVLAERMMVPDPDVA